MQENLLDLNIETESAVSYGSRAYLEYAMSVNKGRALPFAQDGLKPVHRRVLHAMNQLNLTPNSAPAKSARVVGDVIGKYHPHGDTSVYDAMVRTTQDFSLRYPLVDGQGNFGSRDGDGPAAMRYTEVRLTKYADLYLDELKKGTVDWGPNYDGHFEEPKIMPARLPMLLANGSSGIGVGMASDIPSHNLRELAAAAVLLIKNKNATLDEVLEHIKGPDLAVGAQIISNHAIIRKTYETGRGSMMARSIYQFDELSRGQWQLVITEMPPDASCAKVMEEIENCLNPKIKKDKKALDSDQIMLKQLASSLIDTVRDASGKEYKLRMVITPTSSKVDRDALLAFLFKNTSLESSVTFNIVAVDGKGTPRSVNLIELLQEWILHRFVCVTRRTQTRLADVKDRIHILEGRSIVFLNVDEVIKIVREADDPKAGLMARFNLSEIQADDILDMRLRQLAGLEGIKIEQELAKLNSEASDLQQLLDEPPKMAKSIIKQIEADAITYGDERRTLMLPAASVNNISAAPAIVDEPICLILSGKDWIKSRQGHDLDESTLTFKEGDSLNKVIKCRSTDNLIAIASDGRVFSMLAGLVQGGRGDGVPVTSLFEFQSGQKLAHIIAGKDTQRVLMYTNNSYGFICQLGGMVSKLKAGKAFMTVKDGAKIMEPVMAPDLSEGYMLAAVSSGGKLLAYDLEQMKTLNAGGQGVTVMGIADDETLQGMAIFKNEQSLDVTSDKGKRTIINPSKDTKFIGSRARKGCILPVKMLPVSVKAIEV